MLDGWYINYVVTNRLCSLKWNTGYWSKSSLFFTSEIPCIGAVLLSPQTTCSSNGCMEKVLCLHPVHHTHMPCQRVEFMSHPHRKKKKLKTQLLAFTLIRNENGAFWKKLSKLEEIENAGFSFSCRWKVVAFRKWFHDIYVISVIELSKIQNDR